MTVIDPLNPSEAEFDSVLNEIDTELRGEDAPIVGRELKAWFKYCQRFQISAPLGDPLSVKIINWFEKLYGDRLNLDVDFGTAAAVVRGDVYAMRCFRFYGTMFAICTPKVLGKTLNPVSLSGGKHPLINILDGSIDQLTPELAGRLDETDCSPLLIRYGRAFAAFSAMEGALASRLGGSDAPYIKEAHDDLRDAGDNLLLRRPNYGQSNWSSLQATEKVLKSYILEKGDSHGKTHRLSELCDAAYKLNLPRFSDALIKAIQCAPEVRYKSATVSKAEALAAYDAALVVCALVCSHVKRTSASARIRNVQVHMRGASVDGLMLEYHPASIFFAA